MAKLILGLQEVLSSKILDKPKVKFAYRTAEVWDKSRGSRFLWMDQRKRCEREILSSTHSSKHLTDFVPVSARIAHACSEHRGQVGESLFLMC